MRQFENLSPNQLEREMATLTNNFEGVKVNETDDVPYTVNFISNQSSQCPGVSTIPPDLYETETSALQYDTELLCVESLAKSKFQTCSSSSSSSSGSSQPFGQQNSWFNARLLRNKHRKFLLNVLLSAHPSSFQTMDASRPWLVYWSLCALAMLGDDVTQYRSKAVNTISQWQNIDGGFGGGQGQISHCAVSYAAILSLVILGGKEAYSCVNRRAMWQWLGRLKQADGGFSVCESGEIDIRGAFCALIILSVLKLPLELPSNAPARSHNVTNFLDGLGNWISSCQTYEGGLGGFPGCEAHGAYTYCGLGCLCLMDVPQETISGLISWLSERQYRIEGGFAGRTNKLVDGCYSHWIGNSWNMIEAAFTDMDCLWSREDLLRYILVNCQSSSGGLCDKPGKSPDAYHTNYTLAGISAGQNWFSIDKSYVRQRTKDLNYPEMPINELLPAKAWKSRQWEGVRATLDESQVYADFMRNDSPNSPHEVRDVTNINTHTTNASTKYLSQRHKNRRYAKTSPPKSSSKLSHNHEKMYNILDSHDNLVMPLNPVYAVPCGMAELAQAWYSSLEGF